ncbi:CHAT domain-containing protein [Actinomadura sp. DSM 109109]|nr:CHAT domain-containing protein [Actinomadura lepetitiana]
MSPFAGPEIGRAYREIEDRARANGIDSVENEAWELLKQAHGLLMQGDASVAHPLFFIARLSFMIEASHSQWIVATAAAMGFSSALRAIDLQCEAAGRPFPEELKPAIQAMADAAGYVAHRSGVPLAGCILAESLTNQMFGDRLRAREISAIIGRRNPRKELRRIYRTLQGMAATSQAALVGSANAAAAPRHELRRMVEAMLLDDLRAGAAQSSEAYVLTAAGPVHAVHGASFTRRSVIYLTPRPDAGAAIRLEAPETGRQLCESIELPGLSLNALDAQARTVRDVLSSGEKRVRVRNEAVTEALQKAAETVWQPVLEAWPDLMGTKVALVPLGKCALLPLYTALIDDTPVCAIMDLTIVPSGDSLMLAAMWPRPDDGKVFVAADPWFGSKEIPVTVREAQNVAALLEVRPRILRWPSGAAPEGESDESDRLRGVYEFLDPALGAPDLGTDGDLVGELAKAGLVHLACHGHPNPQDPLRSALLLGRPLELSVLLNQDLRPGATVVLSACQLADIGTEFAAEQLGFPAALLAMGARSVIGALWRIPDSDAMVTFMMDLHRNLRSHPPSVALGQAIGQACAEGQRATVWAPFAHFGA